MIQVIPPTARQREIELQVTARHRKNETDAVKGHYRDKTKNPYTRKTRDKPKPDGVLIRKLMNQAKLRPRDLAEKVKIKSDQLQKIFRGVGTDQPILDCIAEFFGIEVKHIIK